MIAALSLSMALAGDPPASEVVRSDDGSAELDALRRRGQRDAIPVTEVEPASSRGLELDYGIALDGASVPASDEGEYDVLGGADRSIIQRKGRRRIMAGVWMIFSGVLVGPAFLAGAIAGARQAKQTPAIVLGSLSVVGFGLLAGGIPLVVRGRKMNKHPERYARIEPVPRLVLGGGPGGWTLRF
ncbi:hypothetical protein ACNOYE_28075 [Nannocystaceae bacterium ST9]